MNDVVVAADPSPSPSAIGRVLAYKLPGTSVNAWLATFTAWFLYAHFVRPPKKTSKR